MGKYKSFLDDFDVERVKLFLVGDARPDDHFSDAADGSLGKRVEFSSIRKTKEVVFVFPRLFLKNNQKSSDPLANKPTIMTQ